MNLDYFLLKKKIYNNLIRNLNSIISDYDELLELSLKNDQNNLGLFLFEISQIKKQKNKLLRYLKDVNTFQMICSNHVKTTCEHQFENDSIDITPERSQNICYCVVCGYTMP